MKLDKRDVTVVDNPEFRMLNNRVGLFNSSFQDFKKLGLPKAQLILTDIPYSFGDKAYGLEISKRCHAGKQVLSAQNGTRANTCA